MKFSIQLLPVAGLSVLMLAGCQTQQGATPQAVSAQPAPVRANAATPAVVDPINDPSMRDNDNGGGGGGGGGGGDSPGGGGGGSWG